MTSGIIFDIKRFALHDGPGTRTTIFLKGCPLRCRWCHNPEGISPQPLLTYRDSRCILCGSCVENCPEHCISLQNHSILRNDEPCTLCARCVETCPTQAWEIIGKTVEAKEVIGLVQKDFLFFDESGGGLTFSGGEPLYQIEFLEDLLKTSKRNGFHTTVDTSGLSSLGNFHRILNDVDVFLYDIKCIEPAKHEEFTTVNNRIILENFRAVSSIAKETIVRVPVIPGFNDAMHEIQNIGEFVRKYSTVRRIDLLPYHHLAIEKYSRLAKEYTMGNAQSVDAQLLASFEKKLRDMGFFVTLGG